MTETFLRELYGAIPAGYWWYLWTLAPDGTRTTHWVNSVEETISMWEKLSKQHINVYYPVAFTDKRGGKNRRIKAAEAAGAVAFVADVDFAVEPDDPRPPCTAEAMKFVKALPIAPTVIVNSGHGLQLVWMLAEPWFAEPEKLIFLFAAWGAELQARASRAGYQIDAVHDVARVMRLPGTWNVKRAPVRAYIVEADYSLRVTVDQVQAAVSASTPPLTPRADLDSLGDEEALRVSLDDLPLAKLEAVRASSPEFEDTLTHTRADMRGKSLSEFDMSIAVQLLNVGWSDSEITAAIHYHRKLHGDTRKVDGKRLDYYARTIKKAKELVAPQNKLLSSDTDRSERIQMIAEALDAPLTNVQKIVGPPGVFRFWFGERCVEIPAEQMQRQQLFIGRVYDLTNRPPVALPTRPTKKQKMTWRDMLIALAEVAEEIDGGVEVTLDGEMVSLIKGWLEDRKIVEVEPGVVIEHYDNPLIRSGCLWFRIESLRGWMRAQGIRMEHKELLRRLRALGATRATFKVQLTKEKQSTKSFWGLPVEKLGVTPE